MERAKPVKSAKRVKANAATTKAATAQVATTKAATNAATAKAATTEPAHDTSGGRPVSFGYKTAWLAIPKADPRAVAEALELANPQPCTWEAGIGGAARGVATFVSPPVDGYTFVVAEWLGDDRQRHVVTASKRFGAAQLFVSQRVVDDYACLEGKQGMLARDEKLRDEEAVGKTAGKWGIDPRTLGERTAATPMGLVARSPNADMVEAFVREELLLQAPARSAREAKLHANVTFRACPGCGESYIMSYPPRRGLPWEPFAMAIPITCANGPCQRHWLVGYPAAPGYEPDLDHRDIATTTTRSQLLDGEAWLAIAAQRAESLREMPEWGYPADKLLDESQKFAREAIACLDEAHKHGATVTAKDRAWLEPIAERGLST